MDGVTEYNTNVMKELLMREDINVMPCKVGNVSHNGC